MRFSLHTPCRVTYHVYDLERCRNVAVVAERDRRVAGVVLLGPTTDPRLRRVGGLVGSWLRTAVREPWRQVPRLLAQWLRTGPRAMAALWRRAAAWPGPAVACWTPADGVLPARLYGFAMPIVAAPVLRWPPIQRMASSL